MTKAKRSGHKRPTQPAGQTLPIGWWLLSFAVLLALISYLPTLRYGFVYDDFQQIVENPAIKSWSNLPQYFTAHVGAGIFPGVKGSFYRPLFLLWLRLNHALFEVAPLGWHLTSLLMHLCAIWMFFLLARQWTGDAMVAGWASLLFAVHPIHIEAVAWISAVPEIHFALAGMGAIYCYVRFRRDGHRTFFYLSLLLYSLALLAKETSIVIWPAILICERWLGRDSRPAPRLADWFALTKLQLPFAGVTGAYVALRVHALRGLRGEVTHTLGQVLSSAPSITWFYLRKLAVPSELSQIYFDPELSSFASPHFYIPLLAVCVVAAGILVWASKSRPAAFAASLLALSLAPPLLGISVFPPHDLAHNRYLYLPSAGACMLFALGLRAAVRQRKQVGTKQQWLATAIVILVAVGLAFSVRSQERPYRDNIALFTHAVEFSPESAMAWGLLGEEYMTQGRAPEGISAFHRAQSLEPNALLNNYRLGAAYYLVQDMPSAEVCFQHAVDSYRDQDVVSYDYALYRLGLSQYAQGKMSKAEATLRQATEIQPKGYGYHLALGAALKYQDKLPEAKKQVELELSLGADAEASKLLNQINTRIDEKTVHD
ncbi:MAG TPA: glycosyltransferase family 39 protein [Candidatus Polarisedimenticolia bacterium]|nr:glycosyltransferase family 39 protein [Candidatus Polarisedimenticolia bacterium]